MPYGIFNPYPFQYGDGPTPVQSAYTALRKAVDEDACGPPGGIEDLWRICKARACAATIQASERAAMQAFADKLTDHLEVWEDILGLPQAPTDQERREAIAAAIVRRLSATIPDIRTELQRIDPNADVESVAYAQATIVQLGKAYGPRVGGPPYGSGASSGISFAGWPNYSDDFVLHVLYALPPSQTQIAETKRAEIERYLNDVLPAWVDWSIYTGHGFFLDGGVDGTSLLDQTAFD